MPLRAGVGGGEDPSLTVDRPERRALLRKARSCRNVVVKVRTAHVVRQSDTDDSSDPRFDTCTEAKANGYGPYHAGTDPEYDWYIDGDADGIACE